MPHGVQGDPSQCCPSHPDVGVQSFCLSQQIVLPRSHLHLYTSSHPGPFEGVGPVVLLILVCVGMVYV